jgi:hypothetical protein
VCEEIGGEWVPGGGDVDVHDKCGLWVISVGKSSIKGDQPCDPALHFVPSAFYMSECGAVFTPSEWNKELYELFLGRKQVARK